MRDRLLGGAMLIGLFTVAACGGSSTPSTTASDSATLNTGNPSAPVTLHEDGSSLLLPYLKELVTPLSSAYSNITLSPAAGGSGKGISDTIAGAVDMGGSDAYLSAGQAQQHPNLANIPIAVSAQDIFVNLPGVSSLKLSGDVLAKIYMGQITTWNDTAISTLNSGVTLPATPIVPVRRVDSSGDTFLFTSFLSATNGSWQNGPANGTTVTWPAVSSELTASGNPGMVTKCQANPGCVAYIGISAQSAAEAAGLTLVSLENQSGQFLTANPTTMAAAVSAAVSSVPANLAQSLIYQSGAQAYPIVNFEYIIVNTQQSSQATAEAIQTFLAWAISSSGGSQPQYLSKENFIALPSAMIPKVQAAIASIQ
jgi:phosphate transport system substrate-binding protein